MVIAKMEISGRSVSSDATTYFIADVAANHDGVLERALELMTIAKEAGADAPIQRGDEGEGGGEVEDARGDVPVGRRLRLEDEVRNGHQASRAELRHLPLLKGPNDK